MKNRRMSVWEKIIYKIDYHLLKSALEITFESFWVAIWLEDFEVVSLQPTKSAFVGNQVQATFVALNYEDKDEHEIT